jgi:glycolate oxidase
LEIDWSDVPEERLAMWQARKGLVPSLSMAKRGQRLVPLVEDFGVPISRIPETIREIEKIGKKLDFPIACFGHVGDGNLHAVIVMDVRKKEEWEKTRIVSEELLNLALRLKGTLTAEHGVGIAKAPYIRKGLGASLDVMRDIKSALDPRGTLNPGKMALDDSVKDIYDYFAFSPAIKGLDTLGEEIDNEILSCIQCGFCRAACPVFEQTYLSSRNTRGRLILAYDLLAGTVKSSPELAEVFYQCTACFNCGVVCPAQVKVTDIIQSVREKLVSEGHLPDIFGKLVANVEQHGNPFGKPKEERTDILPKDSVKRIADLSQEFPKAETQGKREPDKTKESPVLLFLGCTSAYVDSQIVPSVVRVLESAGVDYNVLGNEECCCGYPAYIIGASSEFKKCVDKNLATISQLDPGSLVVVCSSCYKTLTKLYPEMDLKISHAVEFIEELIVGGRVQFSKKRRTPRKVVYHDPCSMGRHMGVYESPRTVLRSIPGVELVEFEMNREQAKCCGGGGGFKVYDKKLSEELGYTRILQAVDVGAEIVTTSCPTCKERLEIAAKRLAKEKGIELKVTYVAELVAEAI